tara:strand:+ start:2787 stop:3521 length:735 start_codon:yes stop_codon:yes gene_type:complete
MGKAKRNPRPIVSDSISNTASQVVLDALDAGLEIEDIAPDKGPKIRGESKFNQEALNEIADITSKGGIVPGQSLSNSPDQPYPWEKPAEFSNPKEALDYMVSIIFEPEVMKNIVGGLANGATVTDISMVLLYTKFTEGKFNPDVFLLLAEPLMYVIMAIGEEANIKYNIDDNNDLDEFDNEDETEEVEGKLKEFKNVFSDIKNGSPLKGVEPKKIQSGAVPQSILDRVEKQGPEIRSLLNRGDS